MKKIIRLTESELHDLVSRTVKRIIREDVLGNDWRENDAVMNNYEPFETQQEETPNEHNWGIKGEEGLDPTHYDNYSDDIVNGGEEDWPEERVLDRIDTNANYDDFPPIR